MASLVFRACTFQGDARVVVDCTLWECDSESCDLQDGGLRPLRPQFAATQVWRGGRQEDAGDVGGRGTHECSSGIVPNMNQNHVTQPMNDLFCHFSRALMPRVYHTRYRARLKAQIFT